MSGLIMATLLNSGYTVRVKNPSVVFTCLAPAGIRLLSAVDQVAQQCHVNLVISCGNEDHALRDPHTTGEALDVSVAGFDAARIQILYNALTQLLGPLFTVLYECPTPPVDPGLRQIAYLNVHATAPHLHLQRKNQTVFPPAPITPATTTSV